ncbi:serine/threonine kinase-like domain-containing protein STKLD1 [Discoglossus pictus]
MDKYKVLEEWIPGAFGATCLVEELEGERKKFAVKKVECLDEREANLALKEAMILLELHHPNICAYKEFFMDWDKKISSLFFCMVMDYNDNGNLGSILQQNRDLQKKIDEQVIQLFLGEAIDALAYSHKANIIHRNLKPSNILLNDRSSFLISDFVVETVMTDESKMSIKVDDECKLWMAPEALHYSYSTKSDVWSLGSILLDMMTCSTHNNEQLAALLHLIRLDSSSLQSVLKTEVGYSSDLCRIPLQMLQVNPQKRPSVFDLIQEPYVQRCLFLIGSPLLGLKKTLPPGVADELNEGGIEKALEFMQLYNDFEDAQISALRHLSKYTTQAEGLMFMEHTVLHVAHAMKTFSGSMDIQLEGCKILQDLASQALEQGRDTECFTNSELILSLVKGIRSFSDKSELLVQIFNLMTMLSSNDMAAELMGKAGVLQDTVKIMKQSLEDRELCLSCCGLLWSVAMAGHSEREWLEHAVPVIFNLIRKHLNDGELVESAGCCLWILCLKGCVGEKQIESVTWVLLDSLQTHPERPVMVKNVCLALASLLRISELAAFRVLVPVAGKSGISLVKDIYQLHCDDPEIAENICLLFNEMARYGKHQSIDL